MKDNFWKKLNKPFFGLAPMANVTDAAFRRIIAKYGKPDVFWTEFVSADGLVSAGRKKLEAELLYTEKERPIVAQLFSAKPEKMEEAAKLILKLGFDGLDINMGCPDKAVLKQGAGGALIKNPALAKEVIEAAKRGLKDKIPVSVKTRIGFSKDETEKWISFLLKLDLAALTVHARTVKELSMVPARWDHVKQAVKLRDSIKADTLIIGNGDVLTIEQGYELAKETGADGIMIGRGIFGNPFLFSGKNADINMRLKVLIEHTNLYAKLMKKRSFDVMKKHFKAYVNGFAGAKELRTKLMEEGNDAKAVSAILKQYLKR